MYFGKRLLVCKLTKYFGQSVLFADCYLKDAEMQIFKEVYTPSFHVNVDVE